MIDGIKALYHLMRDAKLSHPTLTKLIQARLKSVLISAYQGVPYYRNMMRSLGYNPLQDYQGPQDLLKFPITTKKILKEREGREFIKEKTELSVCYQDATSGSTGIPLQVYRNSYERALQMAAWLRVLFMNGYSVFDKVLSFTSPRRLKDGQSFVQHFGLLRRQAVDYRLSAEEMTNRLLAYQPDLVYGNRAQLDLVALELQKRGIQPEGLKILIGGAEVIHEHNRHLYREHFGVELAEFYGSVEMGTMAYETPAHNGLHLCEDLIYFEFLDDHDQPVATGQPGRVVVTDLTRVTMPFIRYDHGDLAMIETQTDSSGYPVRRIVKIMGRDEDFLLMPDGTKRSFHEFYEIMHRYHGVRQFRIIQKQQGIFHVLLVVDHDYFQKIYADLQEQLQKKFSSMFTFEIFRVEHLEADPNGKFKRIISEVA